MVDSSTFQTYFPLAIGAINGAEIIAEPEPRENIPYLINPVSNKLMQWSEDEDAEIDNSDESRQKSIFVLPIRGIMTKHDQLCGPSGTRTLSERLKSADKLDQTIGHIVVFETGGGSANSVPELAEAIQQCKKPVIAWVDGYMCSAGQYAGSYCREIIASRESDIVGSVGTMMVYEGRKKESGENSDRVIHLRIYADDATGKNEEYEAAINESNFKPVKERILNPHNEQFIADVKANRPGIKEEHLHGRVFKAGESIGSLVDSIGNFDFAISRVLALAEYKPAETSNSRNSQTQNDTSTQISFIMKYPKIALVLSLNNESFVMEADGRRTFTEEEMAAVESALNADNSEGLNAALTETQSQLDAANNTIAAREATIAERDSRIAELETETANLRNNPADTTATAITDTDATVKDKNGKAVSAKYDDPMDALNEVSEEYLNRKL